MLSLNKNGHLEDCIRLSNSLPQNMQKKWAHPDPDWYSTFDNIFPPPKGVELRDRSQTWLLILKNLMDFN